jgi:hypothetical protein
MNMVLAVNQLFGTVIIVTDENNNPATGKIINYRIFDETHSLFASGTMTEVGSYGIYIINWTPDSAGIWVVESYYSGSDFHFYDAKSYQVQEGIEDAVEDRIKAIPSIDSIFFKSGGAYCPTSKSIWDALGDGTISLNTLNSLLTNATYGLSALNTDIDSIIASITDGTTGLAVIKAYVDSLETWLGNPSAHTLTTITNKLGNNTNAIGTVTDRLYNLVQTIGAISGTPTVNFFVTDLTEATNDHYNGCFIIITSGALAGQASLIVDYDGATKSITVDPVFIETPVTASTFIIVNNPLGALRTGSKGLEQIYDLNDSLPIKLNRIGDTITTTASEANLYISDAPEYNFEPYKLIVDLTNMANGDTILIKEYYRIKSGGNYILKRTYTYNDIQSPSLDSINLEPNIYGVKLTVQRTAGSDKALDIEIWSKER